MQDPYAGEIRIGIGGFYRTQSPASFAKWRDETPDDFVFSVKGPRYATHRSTLADAGESISRFFAMPMRKAGAARCRANRLSQMPLTHSANSARRCSAAPTSSFGSTDAMTWSLKNLR